MNLCWDPPPSLVPRRDILEIRERINSEGNIVTPLQKEDLEEAIDTLKKRGMNAVAVCFINSFMNPKHELKAKEIIQKELPGVYVSTSCEILPEIREFERFSTTVANAYIGPIVKEYLEDFKKELNAWGFDGDILITHAGGGLIPDKTAKNYPIQTIHSSPISGVVGLAGYIGDLHGFKNVLSFEMGGTTTDLSIIEKGEAIVTTDWKLEWNIPICVPMVDSRYLGAGGGSIAWIDKYGVLKNGPKSAGGYPGPACFALGGTEPTNTDAHMILGQLNPENLLGGKLPAKKELALKAMEKIAANFNWSLEEAGAGILQLADATIALNARLFLAEKGYDPRDFAMVAYGGAGPMHAVYLARELKIPVIVVPPLPGYGSVIGTLRVDLRHDFLKPILRTEREINIDQLNEAYAKLEREAISLLRSEGIPEGKITLTRSADAKYYNQVRYLRMPVSVGQLKNLSILLEGFKREHMRRYGYLLPQGYVDVEIVNIRVTAFGSIQKPVLERYPEGKKAKTKEKEERQVYWIEKRDYLETPIFDRFNLPVSARIDGPAIIEQPDSTILLPPGATAEIDNYLNLVINP